MTWLDCQTHESALRTLSSAVELPEDLLAEAIVTHKPTFDGKVDPVLSYPQEVLGRCGVELEQVTLDGALLFHGTRLSDPESVIHDGLQPLSQRLEAIWEMLGGLARPESGEKDWRDFRNWVETDGGDDDGWQYRLKTGDAMHHGPFTVLVRDTLTRPEELGWHDYLDCPEIIQDICRCYRTRFGVDLEERFKEATEPCVVTLRRSSVADMAIGTAIWFIRTRLLGSPLSLACAGGSEPPRGPIAPRDVVAVDVHSPSSSRNPGRC